MTTNWTGFSSFINFAKATASLGIMLIGGVWAVLAYALDDRYAPAELVGQVSGLYAKVDTVQASVTEIRTNQLSDRLFDLKVKSCERTTTPASKQFYAHRQQALSAEYKVLTGNAPFLPSCDELQ